LKTESRKKSKNLKNEKSKIISLEESEIIIKKANEYYDLQERISTK